MPPKKILKPEDSENKSNSISCYSGPSAPMKMPISKCENGEDIFEASANNCVDRVKELLLNGEKANQTQDFNKMKNVTPLIYAAKNGALEVAEILVSAKADINALSRENCDDNKCSLNFLSPLYHAAARGDAEFVKFLLEKGAHPNSRYNEFKVLEAGLNYLDVVKILIDFGANIYTNWTDDFHQPAIVQAAALNNCQVVHYLLKKGIDPNVKTWSRPTPLAHAIYLKNYGMISVLIDYNAKIGMEPFPIHNVLEGDDLFMLEFLIYKNVNLNVDAYWYSRMPFHHVRSLKAALLLGKHGVDLNPVDKFGNTPLHLVFNREIQEFLIQKGADIEKLNSSGDTPLAALAFQKNLEKKYGNSWEPLVNAGAQLSLKGSFGNNLLHFSSAGNNPKLLEYLILKGVEDINAVNSEGLTPLHLASRNTSYEAIEILLKHGVNVNIETFIEKRTPLTYSVNSNCFNDMNVKTTDLLLQNGANPNHIYTNDSNQKTSILTGILTYSSGVSYCELGVLKLLLDAGVDVKTRDPQGKCPLDYIIYSTDSDKAAKELLIAYGADKCI